MSLLQAAWVSGFDMAIWRSKCLKKEHLLTSDPVQF